MMDIGEKLRTARKQSGMTQEQAAEAIGVSRQTLSNWENGKTYPDIVSVIKISDLYAVSLDRLLKEESAMKYLDYLEESTDTVRSKDKLMKVIAVCSYTVVWALAVAAYWIFTAGADIGGSVEVTWTILPIVTFILSALIGRYELWGAKKWYTSIAFGVLYALAFFVTFDVLNYVLTKEIDIAAYRVLPTGICVSLAGILAGHLLMKHARKKTA